MSSKEPDKYEYLSCEDLGYKPIIIEKAKFEYSSLGRAFNEGSNEYDKKEVVLKMLKDIEGKNEEQFRAIENQEQRQLRLIEDHAKKQLDEIKNKNIKDNQFFKVN